MVNNDLKLFSQINSYQHIKGGSKQDGQKNVLHKSLPFGPETTYLSMKMNSPLHTPTPSQLNMPQNAILRQFCRLLSPRS